MGRNILYSKDERLALHNYTLFYLVKLYFVCLPHNKFLFMLTCFQLSIYQFLCLIDCTIYQIFLLSVCIHPSVLPSTGNCMGVFSRYECKNEGRFSLSGSCWWYVQCVDEGDGVLSPVLRRCPPGTAFSTILSSCLEDAVVKV